MNEAENKKDLPTPAAKDIKTAVSENQEQKKEIGGKLDKLNASLVGGTPVNTSKDIPKISRPNPPSQTLDNNPSKVQSFMEGKFANSTIKPLRTYRTDVEEAVQNKKESVTTIALAEHRRRESRGGTEGKYKKALFAQNSLIIFLITALVITGIGSLFIFIYAKSQEQKAVSTFYKKTIIPADREIVIDTGEGLSTLIQDSLKTVSLERGDIAFLKIVSGGEDLTASGVISVLSPSTPAHLLRSFKDYMFGILSGDKNNLFILIKTDSFETGFSGMLEWEKTIVKDLGPFFFETATSTQNRFEDTIVKNKDTRVVRNARREILFIYAFLDRETILISGTTTVFDDILNRYFNSKLVQ